MHEKIEWQDLGCIPFAEAWRLQEKLRDARETDRISDRFLFVEHPPAFTLGKRDCTDDFLTTAAEIASDQIEIVKCNRGGRITYHGPGQIVGYFIFRLKCGGIGVKDFVHRIEAVCMKTLSDFGIDASRDEEHPGLWIGKNKLVAIGLNVSNGITQHGFAMNVDCDLKPYRHIVACGIKDRGVTNISSVLGLAPDKDAIKRSILSGMVSVFSREVFEI